MLVPAGAHSWAQSLDTHGLDTRRRRVTRSERPESLGLQKTPVGRRASRVQVVNLLPRACANRLMKNPWKGSTVGGFAAPACLRGR
jgi:hypothetical protein